MEILALIPARGGSKGVPRKNIREVAGKPLIAYSIEVALQSSLITRVIVSTEDDEIAEVAHKFGAEIPFKRPEEFAQDSSLDLEVFQHALQWLQENENYQPDIVIHFRPTEPLRRVSTIDKAIREFMSRKDVDSLRSVNVATETPFKMWFINEHGLMEPVIHNEPEEEKYNLPRQALPLVYWQNGYIDITRPHIILEQKKMVGKNVLPFVIEERMIGIDYEESLKKMEELLAHPQSAKIPNSSIKRYPV